MRWSRGLTPLVAGLGAAALFAAPRSLPRRALPELPGPAAAQLGPPPLFTPASLHLQRLDFSGPWARTLGPLHRGLNLNLLEDSSNLGSNGFADVAGDSTFRGLVTGLGAGALRVPGGTLSNYYDHEQNKAWIDWAPGAGSRFNKDPAIDWSAFWGFHSATGALPLVSTANVYKSGSRSLPNWISPSVAASWVSAYRTERGLTGAYWETGNETYIGDHVPGLLYPGSTPYSLLPSYLNRACALSTAVKGADATAQVGLVVYEHQAHGAGFGAVDNAATFCGLGAFDFFILHDYAPLYPQSSDGVTFYQGGVEQALSYQGLVRSVSDLRAHLESSHPSHKDKPILVTEYGVLAGSNGAGLNLESTNWYNKTASLLLLHHYLDLVTQGADGLWYWDPLHRYFRLIDPDTLATSRLYELLGKAFAQRGKLLSVPVSGGSTYHVTGPISSGCLEGQTEGCWYTALGAVSLINQPHLKVFAALSEGMLVKRLVITVLNFADAPHSLTMDLSGFSGPGYHGTWSVSQWQVAGGSWDAVLGASSSSSYTLGSSGGAGTLSGKLIPARSAVIFELTL